MTDPITPTPSLQDLAGLRAGWKTSEFWITLGAYVAGTVLIARGQDMIGGILMSVATGGYHVSRGLAKHGENAAVAASN